MAPSRRCATIILHTALIGASSSASASVSFPSLRHATNPRTYGARLQTTTRAGSQTTSPPSQRPPTFAARRRAARGASLRSEEHTSELQSRENNSYAVLLLKNKK